MMEFTADQVWACAAAAQRINGAYLKEAEWLPNAVPPCRGRDANKNMVKDWLRTGNFVEVTESDYAAGRSARDHFKSYTLLALTGQLNDFQKTAMRIAAKDAFTGRDLYDFAVVSCLPSVAQRDQQRTELKREIYTSEQLRGAEGDAVQGDIVIINSRYNVNFNKFKIQARMGESFVDFWFNKDLAKDATLRIKGKIKNIRGDKTTQLNYVKISG